MRARLMLTIVVVVAMITAACGDSKSLLLPTAPSALSAETPNVDASATAAVSGTMGNGPKPGNGTGNNGNGNNNGGGNGGGNSPAPVTTETTKVELEGLIDAVDNVNKSITVNGQVVNVTGATVIRHGDRIFQFSDLRRGDRVHVKANRVATTLEATEIKLQNPGDVVVAPPPPPPPDPDAVVSVTAFDAAAMEGADTGTFRLSRTGTATQLAAPLSVSFTLTGTASAADYAAIPLIANFLANQATADVTVTPVNDGVEESPESVILTLSPGAGYQPGSPASATVMISDPPDPDQVVSVTAPDAIAYETTPAGVPDNGAFQLMRTGTGRQLANSLTVSFALNGSAANGSDYVLLALTATFAPNAPTANVTVTPRPDGVTESPESVILTLTAGAGYQVGSPSSAELTIADAPPPQVSITVPDPLAGEIANDARFVVSRSGSLSLPLTVTVLFSGTAGAPGTAGTDYLVQGADNNNVNPITVTFPTGVSEMMIRVIPHMDDVADPNETVEFTVVDGDAYDLGPIFSGLITILGG